MVTTPARQPQTVRLSAAAAPRLLPVFTNGVVAIGNFDGVHRGHQALLAAAADEAARIGSRVVALTFEPHPRAVLRPDTAMPRLTPEHSKLRLLGALGIDAVAVVDFDRDFAALEAETFVARVLRDQLRAKAVVVGEDFRFGRGRAGNADLLRHANGDRLDVVTVAPVVDAGGVPFSSGRVRESLGTGAIADANALLGYRWFAEGEVVHGDKRGRELGFPTANLKLDSAIGLRFGIYAVTLTRPGGQPLPAVASYGVRPTFDGGAALLEVHVFDFDASLYGEHVVVTFFDWLRGEERFASVDALVAQMRTDSANARAVLAAAGPGTHVDRALAGTA